MTNVNKEVASKLKKLGFNHPYIRRPDFFEAAAFLWEHHKLETTFYMWATNIDDGKNNTNFSGDRYPDHRNAAMSFACDHALK